MKTAPDAVDAAKVGRGLGIKNLQTVRGALNRLADEGRIKKIGHGQYRGGEAAAEQGVGTEAAGKEPS